MASIRPEKLLKLVSFCFKLDVFYVFVTGTFTVKSGLAQMAKGGVVMDVTNEEQARIAEQAGVSPCVPFFKPCG